MSVCRPPDWLHASHLVAPVRRLVGGSAVIIDDWASEPISGGASDTLRVWRVTGDATIDGATTPFALVLKGWVIPEASSDPASWNWPLREVRAYASGVLDDLPGGIRAPTCLGTVSCADRSVWAWLTPMSNGARTTWALEDFALVAQRLGQFNGAYLAERPLPDDPWLSRHWTRQWTEAAADAMDAMARDATRGRHAQAFPPGTVRALRAMWDERHRWLDALDAFPQTFCHLDAFRRNAFLCPKPGGDIDVSLIDWEFSGIAALGEDIVSLVASSLVFGEAPGISPDALDSAVFEGYLRGLHDAGWNGDETSIRAAYTGALSLRYGLGTKRVAQQVLTNDELHPVFERTIGAPIDVIVDRLAGIDEWVIDVATEFRRLIPSLPLAKDVT